MPREVLLAVGTDAHSQCAQPMHMSRAQDRSRCALTLRMALEAGTPRTGGTETWGCAADQKVINEPRNPGGRAVAAALKVGSLVGSLCRTCACPGHNILGLPRLRRRPHFWEKI